MEMQITRKKRRFRQQIAQIFFFFFTSQRQCLRGNTRSKVPTIANVATIQLRLCFSAVNLPPNNKTILHNTHIDCAKFWPSNAVKQEMMLVCAKTKQPPGQTRPRAFSMIFKGRFRFTWRVMTSFPTEMSLSVAFGMSTWYLAEVICIRGFGG